MTIQEGDPAPAFDLPTASGRVASATLSGRPYVIYFYPKDDTPGCTKEAIGFSRVLPRVPEARRRGDRRLEGRRDQPRQVREEVRLCFPLGADEAGSVVEAFGAWAEKSMYGKKYMGIDRSTFLVGPDGRIARAWRGSRCRATSRRCSRPRAGWPRGRRRRPPHARPLGRAALRLLPPGRAARAPGPRGPARGDRRAPGRRHAQLGRAEPAPGAPRRADRRAPRARGRLLHRLHHADPGAGPAAGRPRRDARGRRALARGRPPLLGAGRRRGPDRAQDRPRGDGPAPAPGRGRPGPVRPRLHRRRQEALPDLLRAHARAGPPGRGHRAGQHASRRRLADPADRSPQTETMRPSTPSCTRTSG